MTVVLEISEPSIVSVIETCVLITSIVDSILEELDEKLVSVSDVSITSIVDIEDVAKVAIEDEVSELLIDIVVDCKVSIVKEVDCRVSTGKFVVLEESIEFIEECVV